MERILILLAIPLMLSSCVSNAEYEDLKAKYNDLQYRYNKLEEYYDEACDTADDYDDLLEEIEEKDELIEQYEKRLGIYDYEKDKLLEKELHDYGLDNLDF